MTSMTASNTVTCETLVCPVCGGHVAILDQRGGERLEAGEYVNDTREVAICAEHLTDMVSTAPEAEVEILF